MIEIGRRIAHALDRVAWAADTFGFQPDPWQAELLRSAALQIILNCGRQTGKSTAIALLATHTAIFEDEALVLLVAPSQRQSAELAGKVSGLLERVEPAERRAEDNKLSLTLERNGSRIVSLPGGDARTIRGYSAPSLIVEDEAAFVGDETYAAILPMLAASPEGRIALLSTPNLCFGHFYDVWHASGAWERYEVPTKDCPRVSAAWLEERRRENPLTYDREYCCKFGSAEGSLFTKDMLDRMVVSDFEPFELGF
jgi:hypothetical protein